VHPNYPSYLGDEDRRIEVQGLLGQKHETLSEKQTKKSQRAGSVAQVLEHLSSKLKALNSIPVLQKKKKKSACGGGSRL
jgi:hypothetical protein